MRKRRSVLPRFASVKLESEYWDNHSLTEHLTSFPLARKVRFRRPRKPKPC
jgi:hypothetical protein